MRERMHRALRQRQIALDRNVAGRVLPYVWPYRRRLLLLLACGALTGVLAVVPAIIVKDFVDYMTRPHRTVGHVVGLFLISVVVIAGTAAVSLLGTYLAETMSHSAVADVRGEVFDHLVGQSVGYFTGARAGDLLSRFMNDIAGLEETLGFSLPTLISNALIAIALLVVMVVFDWRLTLLTLFLVPLIALPARPTARRTYHTRARVQEQYGAMATYLQETLSIAGMMLVKSLGRSSTEQRRFATINEELRQREIKAGLAGQAYLALIGALQTLGPIIFVFFGTYLVVHGQTTLGTLLSFALVLVLRLATALNSVAQSGVALLASMANWARVFEVLDETNTVHERADARSLTTARGELRFEAVKFSYAAGTHPALDAVTFEAQPGELVALVGPSGAGKTTLGSLALRFYDPQAGRVLIDGHDLRDLTLSTISALTGVVFQDTFLFNETLHENLLYAAPDASREELESAVRRANLETFVASLPDGYDTLVGERGYRLSGGERQRVAIARVMLRNPRILLLDEATSHLDSISEQLVQEAIAELFVGRTSLVIAHRLSTVIAADKIVVLDGGRIVDEGTHGELLARGGLYGRLYDTQLRRAA